MAASNASSVSSSRARNSVASSRSAASRRHSDARRSPEGASATGGAEPGVPHPSSPFRGWTRPRAGSAGSSLSAKSAAPGRACARTRPHYPRRMPGTPPTRFAYLGPEGTFAEAALSSAVASSEGARYPQPSVAAALVAVRTGEADAALVPLENSVEGSVPATMDGLAEGNPLVITREGFLPVTMTLAARPGTALTDVRSVASHPHAIAQSSRWLADHLP